MKDTLDAINEMQFRGVAGKWEQFRRRYLEK